MKVINGIKFYSSKELCALLDISDVTLRKYRREGRIAYTTIGRGKYSSEKALSEYLSGKTEPKPKG